MALKAHSDPRPAWATAVIEGPCGLEVGGGGGGDGAAAICSDSGRGTFSSSPAFLSRGTLTERIVPPGVFTFIVFPVFPFGTFILNMRLPPGLEGEFMVASQSGWNKRFLSPISCYAAAKIRLGFLVLVLFCRWVPPRVAVVFKHEGEGEIDLTDLL